MFTATPVLFEAPIILPSLQNHEEKEGNYRVFSLFSSNFLLQFIFSTTAQRTITKKIRGSYFNVFLVL